MTFLFNLILPALSHCQCMLSSAEGTGGGSTQKCKGSGPVVPGRLWRSEGHSEHMGQELTRSCHGPLAIRLWHLNHIPIY